MLAARLCSFWVLLLRFRVIGALTNHLHVTLRNLKKPTERCACLFFYAPPHTHMHRQTDRQTCMQQRQIKCVD